jgi:hypothetical protein
MCLVVGSQWITLLIPIEKDPDGSFSIGADDETRVFEPLAITGLQLVEKVSAHSFHQNSHSFAAFAKYRIILSSSFSSTLGESKFDSRVILKRKTATL